MSERGVVPFALRNWPLFIGTARKGASTSDPRREARPAHAGAKSIGLEKTRRPAVRAREGYRRCTIALLERNQVNREWRPLANSDI